MGVSVGGSRTCSTAVRETSARADLVSINQQEYDRIIVPIYGVYRPVIEPMEFYWSVIRLACSVVAMLSAQSRAALRGSSKRVVGGAAVFDILF